jgi:hypothetical protein
MLRGSKNKSFGVREELRGSGPAIMEILADVQGLVGFQAMSSKHLLNVIQMARYLESQPFICIKSEVFFEFQAR